MKFLSPAQKNKVLFHFMPDEELQNDEQVE